MGGCYPAIMITVFPLRILLLADPLWLSRLPVHAVYACTAVAARVVSELSCSAAIRPRVFPDSIDLCGPFSPVVVGGY